MTSRLGGLGSTGFLPGLVAAGATLAFGAVAIGWTPTLAIAAAFCWVAVVPGVALHRTLRGRPDTLVADLALGTTTGLGVQLAGWAVLTGLGLGGLQLLWPLAVLLPVLALPDARRRALDFSGFPQRVSPLAAWTAAGAVVLAFVQAVGGAWAPNRMPPGATSWYQDSYWYLGGAAELERTITPQIAQTAGEPFLYHWFSTAFMASLHTVSGVDLAVVVGRAWILPIVWLLVGTALALSLRLAGVAGPGALAALLTVTGAEIQDALWYRLAGFETLTLLSPSQVFGLPVLALALDPLLQLVRGERLRGGWGVLALALLTSAGAKSSILPVLLCATALAVVVALVRRQHVRGALAALGATLVGQAAGLPLSAGGGAGTSLQLFAILGAGAPWRAAFGPAPIEAFSDAVLPGASTPEGVPIIALLLLAYLVHALWLLPAVPLLRRLDPAAWLLLGVGIAGFSAMMLVNHDGLSQAYFYRGSMPILHVLGAWGAYELVRRETATVAVRVRAAALGAAAGLGIVALARGLAPTAPAGPPAVTASLGLSLGTVVGGALLLGAAAWILRRRAPATAPWTALVAAPFAAALLPALEATVPPAVSAPVRPAVLVALLALTLVVAGLHGRRPVAVGTALVLVVALTASSLGTLRAADARPVDTRFGADAAEFDAARWLASNAGASDVVATNVHCLPKQWQNLCDARAFWVSGLSERRVLIEGWAYTEAAHRQHGEGGRSSRRQPFHDAALFKLNEDAFYAPTADGLRQLRARGVRWLYADSAVAPVSPDLARLATLRYGAGSAAVYELTP